MQKTYPVSCGSCHAPLVVTLDAEEDAQHAPPADAVLQCPECQGRIDMAVDHGAENIRVTRL